MTFIFIQTPCKKDMSEKKGGTNLWHTVLGLSYLQVLYLPVIHYTVFILSTFRSGSYIMWNSKYSGVRRDTGSYLMKITNF